MNPIKKKIAAAVSHIKSHPAIYGYLAGGAVATVAMTAYFASQKLVNIEDVAQEILDKGQKGMYWETPNGTIIAFLNETLETPITGFKE